MPPDQILHSGIKVLQQKLATLIQELSGVDPTMANNNMNGGGQSPDMMDMGGAATAYGGNTAYGDNGYTTPYGVV